MYNYDSTGVEEYRVQLEKNAFTTTIRALIFMICHVFLVEENCAYHVDQCELQ